MPYLTTEWGIRKRVQVRRESESVIETARAGGELIGAHRRGDLHVVRNGENNAAIHAALRRIQQAAHRHVGVEHSSVLNYAWRWKRRAIAHLPARDRDGLLKLATSKTPSG